MTRRQPTRRQSKPQQRAAPAAALLGWYDAHARILPWRVGPAERRRGTKPDPYAVWLSEIMLQQTTVATVTPRYRQFLERWPTIADLAAAPLDAVLAEWAGLGYYARARNLHKCALAVVADHGGEFPDTEEALKTLPGIGQYTAAAIAAIAFDRRAVVIDGNIERVVSRYFAIETPLPASKPEIRDRAEAFWPQARSGDFAQALMDLGSGVCAPRGPKCDACPLNEGCAGRAKDLQNALPRKVKKQPKPTRYGAVYVLVNATGSVLFERRPEAGLLGGMLGLPGGDWTPITPEGGLDDAPARTRWERVGEARHTFTHFHLVLEVFAGRTRRAERAGEIWLAPADAALPTVMKKALAVFLDGEGAQQNLFRARK